MDKYDPKKKYSPHGRRMGHLVGCGTRYDPRPSVPAKHDARRFRGRSYPTCLPQIYGSVKMTNIAQIVNVLQSMILTKGKDMVLTPTYHVFEMYKVHQDATFCRWI